MNSWFNEIDIEYKDMTVQILHQVMQVPFNFSKCVKAWSKQIGVGVLGFFAVNVGVAHAGPQIEHWTLDNGAKIYLVQTDALPMLDVSIVFDGGARRDPDDKVGLTSLMSVMSERGLYAGENPQEQPALDENEFIDAWLDLGAIFSANSGRDEFGYSLRTLTYSDVLPSAVALAAHAIAHPSFSQEVLKREQARAVAELHERLTKPDFIARRTYYEHVYGNHPYGSSVSSDSIKAITVDDLKAFHATYILPCRARVSMVGNISHDQANTIAQQLLAQLPQSNLCPDLPKVPEVMPLTQAISEDIPFKAAQAQIYIGQPGIKRDDRDFLILVVGNHILGGNGFSSRLMQQVREERGLTYGVSSYFSPGQHAGAFSITLKTRPDQAQEAVEVSKHVLEDFVKNGPTLQELQEAKANLIGGFPLMFDSNAKLLAQVANIARYNLPLDYLDQWPHLIDAVSAQQIQQAFKRVIDLDRMVIIVVGAHE